MKDVHPVSCVSVLPKHKQDLIGKEHLLEPKNVEVIREEEWGVKDFFNFQRQNNNLKYLIDLKQFGIKHNSWEQRNSLAYFSELMIEFDSTFPDAVS